MTTIYHNIIKELIIFSLKYRLDTIDLYELKNELWQSARNISEPSEKKISEELLYFESDLDEVQVTYDDPKIQKQKAMEIIKQLEDFCYSLIEIH